MAERGGRRLDARTLDRIRDGAKCRMCLAAVGDAARNSDEERGGDKWRGDGRGKPLRQCETARRQPDDRHDDGKRVADGIELLKQQMEDEIGHECNKEKQGSAPLAKRSEEHTSELQ